MDSACRNGTTAFNLYRGASASSACRPYFRTTATAAARGRCDHPPAVTATADHDSPERRDSLPLFAAPGGIWQRSRCRRRSALTQSALAPIYAEAVHRWELAGITAAQDMALPASPFQIVDISGGYLGQAKLGGNSITLDDDAAGYGWYVDPTPWNDAEFPTAASGTRLYTTPDLAPAGRMDLLTTVMHELGHVLGKDSSFNPADRDDLMYAFLTTGERRLPIAGAHMGDDWAAIDWWASHFGAGSKHGGVEVE